MKKISIAIDGPSASGKSTIAKRVAKELGYSYLDTGAMYRSISLYIYRQGIDIEDKDKVIEALDFINISFKNGDIYLNGEDVSLEIRQEYISKITPRISSYKEVRTFLVAQQKSIAAKKEIIMDGRDIGSVVIPDAELKIYQVASVECRAMRRYQENIARGIECDYETVKQDVIDRDYEDMNKEVGALIKCADAIEIDTSDMEIEEVVSKILALARERMEVR